MQETGAVEFAQDGGELFEEHALEVDVFLVRADDVGGGGEGVVVAVVRGGGGGGMGGTDVVRGFGGGDHVATALPVSSKIDVMIAQRARALKASRP